MGEADKKIKDKEDNLQAKSYHVQSLESQLRESQEDGTLTRQTLQSTQQ